MLPASNVTDGCTEQDLTELRPINQVLAAEPTATTLQTSPGALAW